MRISKFSAASFAILLVAACGGGDGAETGSGEPSAGAQKSGATAEGRVVTHIANSEAKAARREAFQSVAILRCDYKLTDEEFVFESDTANVIDAKFTLERTNACGSDEDLGERTNGFARDQMLPPEIKVQTIGVNFKEKDMTLEKGDVILKAEFTANGKTAVDELACRAYMQGAELGLSCDMDGVRVTSIDLPATPDSNGEAIRITLQGQPRF